jgi:hypothetical protein
LGFLAILPLLWAALRCDQRATATVAVILSCFAVWGTIAGGGPFARDNLNDSFLLLVMFLISITVPALALSADVAVRRRSEENLRASQGELGLISHQLRDTTLDLETVLSTIIARAVQLSDTEAGAIYVREESSQKLQLRATYGMSDAMIAAISGIAVDDNAAVTRASTERKTVQIPDMLDTPACALRNAILSAGFRAILVVPLLRPDQFVGVLMIRRRQPGLFPKYTVELVQTLANHSVLAIHNAHLFSGIEEKSRELELRTSQSRASWRLRTTTCASRCTPWVYLSSNCAGASVPRSAASSSNEWTLRLPPWTSCSMRCWTFPSSISGWWSRIFPNFRSRVCSRESTARFQVRPTKKE